MRMGAGCSTIGATTFNIMTHCIISLNKTSLSIMTLSNKNNDAVHYFTHHNGIQYNDTKLRTLEFSITVLSKTEP